MAIIQKRDPEAAKRTLAQWLGTKMPDARDITITVAGASEASGFSSDTIIFDATWNEAGRSKTQGFVVRAEPVGEAIFREYEIGLQFRIMRALGTAEVVPIPEVYWLEEDTALLGAPFFAMERRSGNVPSDNPPYTMDGFLLTATPQQRRTAYIDGIDVLIRLATVDWRALGLDELDRRELGALGQEQLFAWQRGYYDWAARKRVPILEHAWEWLSANRPDDDHLCALNWGDARLGNLMFDEQFRVRAVLDWEMARIGNPEFDLAWYLLFDHHYSDALGIPKLDGFPSDEESIALWEAGVGRKAEHIEFYTVFAMVFFAGIMMRVVQSNVAHGAPGAVDLLPMETDSIPIQMLERHFSR